MRRCWSALGAAVLLVAMVVPTASAAAPSRDRFIDSGEFDIDCGEFTLHETYTDRMTITEWTRGSTTYVQVHHRWSGVITGPGGIEVLLDPSHFTNFITIRDGEQTDRQVGLIYRYVVPGIGRVALDAGVIEFAPDGSVTIHGPHDVWDTGLEPLICPLFE
jgi:hypothetical protein